MPYALKLLQSEGELTIASTGTDAATGNLLTHEYKVEGPMSLFMTTTAINIDEELMNRCLVLSVDDTADLLGYLVFFQTVAESQNGGLVRRAGEFVQLSKLTVQRGVKEGLFHAGF